MAENGSMYHSRYTSIFKIQENKPRNLEQWGLHKKFIPSKYPENLVFNARTNGHEGDTHHLYK